jgi:hypothetical protein
MKNASLEQGLQQQVRDEIGDEENIKFPKKNILLQKFGVIPPVLLQNEIAVAEAFDGRT